MHQIHLINSCFQNSKSIYTRTCHRTSKLSTKASLLKAYLISWQPSPMETQRYLCNTAKAIAFLLFLSLTSFSASARILDEQPEAPVAPPEATSADAFHTLTFFMHDILGGTNPTAQAMTGVVNNPAINGQIPFAKPNGAVLPFNNAVPENNGNNGLINNNNLPFLIGLGGSTSAVLQNNGGNFISGGQLPSQSDIQKLMFGTMTVFDDELTEGKELRSGLVGRAQGFYVVSSEDGTSQTMAFTVMFESGHYADTLTFFGIHRTVVSESQLAIMGGTGKYLNAKGFATVKTYEGSNQHETDGAETVLEFAVYLTY